jgi:glycosyltransferase involved in cell wall biosynthesis
VKILFAADVSIEKVIGGAERVLFEQTTRLAERGHRVFVLTRRLNSHQSEHEQIKGVHEWRYSVNNNNPLSFIKSTLKNGRALFESLDQKHQFDLINFHQPFSSLSVLHSKRSRAIKKIYTCHSLSFEEYQSRNPKPRNPVNYLFYQSNVLARKIIEKNILKKSDGIVVLSRFTQKRLSENHHIQPEKISIIPGGVDLSRFLPCPDKSAVRQKLKIPGGKFILFTVRNLVLRMGLENLLFAFKDILKKEPETLLIIGGEGLMKESLYRLTHQLELNNDVRLTGYIDDEELPLYYQTADLFILPTKELEGFGLVTLEAMASGLPVLGTPVGGIEEILGVFNKDFLFKDEKPASIAEKTEEFIKKSRLIPNFKKDISFQCRNFVESNYSWDKNVNNLEKFFLHTLRE